jgi:HSP20 family molecular chaperone IbpA
VKETSESYIAQVDLPGFKKDDITIDVHDRILTITAERPGTKVSKDSEEFIRVLERFQGVITRSINLPEDADEEGIEAECVDGVLHMEIKKKPTGERTVEIKKKIEVK